MFRTNLSPSPTPYWHFLHHVLVIVALFVASPLRGQMREILDIGESTYRFDRNPSPVDSLAFSPDGKIIAGHGFTYSDRIRLWDVDSREQIASFRGVPHSGHVPIAFSRDGKQLVAVCWDEKEKRTVCLIWEVATHRLLRSFQLAKGDCGYGWVLAENDILVTTSDTASAVYYDLTKGEVLCRLTGHDYVTNIAVSRDGKRFATLSTVTRNVIVWDVEKRKQLFELNRGPDYGRGRIAFSPDGKYIAAAALEHFPVEVILWDLSTKKPQELDCRRPLGPKGQVTPPGRVRSFVFSPNSEDLIVLNIDDLIFWDVRSGKRRAYLERKILYEALYSMELSPDGRLLAIGENKGVISLWDVPPPEQRK